MGRTADNLRQYAAYSPRARNEYRECQQAEGELLRGHGMALAPPMPFELVAAWLDAGAPATAEEPALALVFDLFAGTLQSAYAWQERARGEELTPEAIISGEAPQPTPRAVWVEQILRESVVDDDRLEELCLRVRCRILLALSYDVIGEGGPFADADALREAVVARATT